MAAFFSSIETAVISTSKLHLKYLAKNGNKRALIVSNLIQKPDQFLRVVLIGTNIAIILSSTISSSMALHFWGDKGVSFSVIIITLVILIFCEIIPKTFAHSNAEKMSLHAAYYIKIISSILSPIEIFISWISNFIIKILIGKKNATSNVFFTKKDLKLFFEIGESEGVLEKKEKSMIEKILSLNEIYIKDVMRPQKYIVAASIDISAEDAIKLMNTKGLSRIPVYKDNLDNIIGFIYAKDFLIVNLKEKLDKRLEQLNIMHPPFFVLDTKKATNVLKEFQKNKIHIAVVIDKDKKICGVVTIEDILEEIFGEIEDEFDKNK